MAGRALVLGVFVLALPSLAGEPVLAPGQAATENAPVAPAAAPTEASKPSSGETTVVGARDEQTLVGDYRQPKWTDRRRFPGVRLYVAPAGAATFEFWTDVKVGSGGGDSRIRTMYELSFGLGKRLQLDLYLRTQNDGANPIRIESERLELRWALADWGVIFGNPTIYLEYIRPTEGPHKAEVKLLFGGGIGQRLFWGVNLFFERELWGGEQTHEYGLVAGLAYSLIDSQLSLGAETRVELVDTRTSRFAPLELEWLIGPSLSWRPIPNAHVLLTVSLGPGFERALPTAPYTAQLVFQPTLVAGWRF